MLGTLVDEKAIRVHGSACFVHNRAAWDRQSQSGESPWVQPVDAATIAAARAGSWDVILTPTISVPRAWFGDLKGRRLLCLASGGGQQAPVLAAAGAEVTSFDNSDKQLAKDRLVADREGLDLTLVQGDMADLSCFEDARFDLIFHPISNLFSADVRGTWRECHRVLRPGGRLLSGFMNPDFFLFDHADLDEGGPLQVRFALPYSDLDDLPPERLEALMKRLDAVEYSHSLDDQIGGQIAAGFVICGFYEDRWTDDATRLNRYMPTSMATLAMKIENPA